jgi:hypothetical protein
VPLEVVGLVEAPARQVGWWTLKGTAIGPSASAGVGGWSGAAARVPGIRDRGRAAVQAGAVYIQMDPFEYW